MGNQNKTQQIIKIPQEQHQRLVIDLDEIIEQWIWYRWNQTKTKSLSRFKREDVLITINWNHVTFIQDNVSFYNSSSSCSSRTLFRTNFDNKTANEHLYTLAIERSTCSIFKFLFTHSLCKSQESIIDFQLPKQIIQCNDTKQCIQFGRDTTKEYELPWNVNSQIRVPSRTRILANLNVDEEEIHSNFSVCIQFSGRITATIATRQSPDICLKFITGDIVQIIAKAMKTNHRLNAFEIIEENSPVIRFTMRGKCSFRYGVKQHIVLNQESLELSSSSCSDFDMTPSAPLEYCQSISSDIKNCNLSQLNGKDHER